MESQLQKLRSSLEEKETRLKEMEEKISALTSSDGKCNRTAELKEMKIKFTDNKYEKVVFSKENSKHLSELTKELENKVKENEYLKSRLKKCTFNLQELVNKELWDKNKEIEKLIKLCEHRQIEIGLLKQQFCSDTKHEPYIEENTNKMSFGTNSLMARDICPKKRSDEVNNDCSSFRYITDDAKSLQGQLLNSLEHRKFLSQKIEELQNSPLNTLEQGSNSLLVQTLQADLVKTKLEKEAVEKSHTEVVSTCLLLTDQLRKLVNLLESLLPSLDAKNFRVVQQMVEHSRQVSCSLLAKGGEADINLWQNLQQSFNTPILPEFLPVESEIILLQRSGKDDPV